MYDLQKRRINGGEIASAEETGFLLSIPAIVHEEYTLAQLDNYMHLPRRAFPHQAPWEMQLEARVSEVGIKGTWGFGLWNDPFSFGFGAGGMSRVLPVLPNAAWFFYASKENYLSLGDHQPGSGFHAKTFYSPRHPSIASLLAAPGFLFLLWPAAARLFRKVVRGIVKEDTKALVDIPVDSWHKYGLVWKTDQVIFSVGDQEVFCSKLSPQRRLGLVIWIDNQYFRFDPAGRLGFGYLPTSEKAFLEIRHLQYSH